MLNGVFDASIWRHHGPHTRFCGGWMNKLTSVGLIGNTWGWLLILSKFPHCYVILPLIFYCSSSPPVIVEVASEDPCRYDCCWETWEAQTEWSLEKSPNKALTRDRERKEKGKWRYTETDERKGSLWAREPTPANDYVPPEVFLLEDKGESKQRLQVHALYQQPEVVGQDAELEEGHSWFTGSLWDKSNNSHEHQINLWMSFIWSGCNTTRNSWSLFKKWLLNITQNKTAFADSWNNDCSEQLLLAVTS